MRADLEIKLLQLTKQRTRISVNELAEHLREHDSAHLNQDLQSLVRDSLADFAQGLIEVDSPSRIRIAERLIRGGCDPLRISRLLEWQEFENFAAMYLERNGFAVVKHFVFKTRKGRREIDLLAWNDTFLLVVDCKHWLRGISPSQGKIVAQAQVERAAALAERLDLLEKRGMRNPAGRRAIPMIFCLGDPRQTIVDGVPVVAVSKFISFLYGVSPVDDSIRMIPLNAQRNQSTLI